MLAELIYRDVVIDIDPSPNHSPYQIGHSSAFVRSSHYRHLSSRHWSRLVV